MMKKTFSLQNVFCRLFWINWDSIHSCKTDGSDLTTHLNSISVLFFGVELMVYKVHVEEKLSILKS